METDKGNIVRGFKSTYKRHGTLKLGAALAVATGAIPTPTTQQKRRLELLGFLDPVLPGRPNNQKPHVILDNDGIPKKHDAWLAAHPKVDFHFTPTSASGLNPVEIGFGSCARQARRRANFASIEHLRQAMEALVAAYGPIAKPFVWRKREGKGAQLRKTSSLSALP